MAEGANYADLPILNLRNINPSGYASFWIALQKRIKSYKIPLARYYIQKIKNKLLNDFPKFMYSIIDISEFKKYLSGDRITNKQFLEILRTKRLRLHEDETGSYITFEPAWRFRRVDDHEDDEMSFTDVDDIIELYKNGEGRVHMVDTKTGEGFEPGRIDSYLSPYGNAMISACYHAMVISKQEDGNYLFIDPHGVYSYVEPLFSPLHGQASPCKIFPMIQRALPPGKTIIESRCMMQGELGVCFLWSFLFLCYPELTVKEIRNIATETFKKMFKNPDNRPEDVARYMGDVAVSFAYIGEQPNPRPGMNYLPYDLYVIAVMDDFLKSDQRKYDHLPPEEKLKIRQLAGRKTRRRKHKNKRKYTRKYK
jgi:hypothetical protein